MSQSKLKPCPFCGGEAILCKELEPDGYCSYKVAFVECDVCGAKAGKYIIDGYYGTNETTRDAINAWNRRHNEDNK